jgi:uncharacterized protein (TIGR01777 family)
VFYCLRLLLYTWQATAKTKEHLMRAVVTGATGFIGKYLLRRLERPVVLSRNVDQAKETLKEFDVTVFEWNPTAGPPPPAAFDGVDIVFHLAGESVAAGRWTAKRKARIRESRVEGTRNLVSGLAQLPAGQRPRVLVSASAVGYYGSREDETLTERSPPGNDFLAEVCQAWEREAQRAADVGVRVAMLRTGIALGPDGGALAKMLTPFKLGVGGRLGSGRQWMPWIHVDDLAALYVHAAQRESIAGAANAVAPGVVRNREFTKALARELHRPAIFPAPYLGLRLVFGEFAKVLFASQKVEPRVAMESGFEFRFPRLEQALADVLHREG